MLRVFLAWAFVLCAGLGPAAPDTAAKPIPPAADLCNLIAPTAEQSRAAQEIVARLKAAHYRRPVFDDQYSSQILDRYLEDLDPSRSYLLHTDVCEFEGYRHLLDDALLSGNLAPPFEIYNRFQQRFVERLSFVVGRLEQGLDDMRFDTNEVLETDPDKTAWSRDTAELDALWLKRLQARALGLKMTQNSPEYIADLMMRQYCGQLSRISQSSDEDAFRLYMNAVTRTCDPHTEYLSPSDSKNFMINMSLSLEGIGAYLQGDSEYTKIMRLVPAGPADKTRQLRPGDRIIGVGQGLEGEIVPVIGWRLDEVVEMIRGPRSTVVRLEIIPVDEAEAQRTRLVSIVRNTVKLEEQAAQKKIVPLRHGKRTYRLGVLDIPTFYLDFQGLEAGQSGYRSTESDVRRLVAEMKDDGVDGIIVDLRDNSGGALQEACAVAGLFIRQGPTVQIRTAQGNVEILEDADPEMIYDGPLAIVVNRISASASEIVAAAIQDYQRGIIVGEQTFGKGTVQAMIKLSHGQLKATQAKFYRISGKSTQQRGVIPDIIYPSINDVDKLGESTLPQSMPYDEILPAAYQAWPRSDQALAQLARRHDERMASDPDYLYLQDMIAYLKARRLNTVVSLNEAARTREQAEADQYRLGLENRRRAAKGQKVFANLAELNTEEAATDSSGGIADDDPVLVEAGHILADYVFMLAHKP